MVGVGSAVAVGDSVGVGDGVGVGVLVGVALGRGLRVGTVVCGLAVGDGCVQATRLVTTASRIAPAVFAIFCIPTRLTSDLII